MEHPARAEHGDGNTRATFQGRCEDTLAASYLACMVCVLFQAVPGLYQGQGEEGFVGVSQKDDSPLCYPLIDRVHHDGRIGDFARTGLLYILEATGRSPNLEEWVMSSDLATLMASGLGALYSQLSRELSILHPDATLPAVLAMSEHSTTHARATAESAFSERHKSHMVSLSRIWLSGKMCWTTVGGQVLSRLRWTIFNFSLAIAPVPICSPVE